MQSLLRCYLLLTVMALSLSAFAQSDDQVLQGIVAQDNLVTERIGRGEYHRHVIDLNADKKDWAGTSGYREKLNCYFEIQPSGEVTLVKIITTLEKDTEKAYQNFVFDVQENVIMSYTDYFRGEERLGQQGAFFGHENIVAVSVNDQLYIGDNLSEEMVTTARKAYLRGLKYKRMFTNLINLQLSDQ